MMFCRSISFLASLFLLITLFPASAIAWNWEQSPQAVGEWINQKCFSTEGQTLEVANVSTQEIKRAKRVTTIRIYTPNSLMKKLPVILFIHGGAWVGGSLETHDNLARYLCQKSEAVVVSVGYLNAPEGKFPLPLEQCYDVLLWIKKYAHKLRADTSLISVVGDSAGGNMAAALCLLTRDRQGPSIASQILINPAPDLTGRGALSPQGDDWDVMRWQALHYVTDPKDVYNPYVSPSTAKDLSRLPRALVILAEKDFLFEDGKRYADQLKKAGVSVNVYIQPEIGHLGCEGARAAKCAQPSLDQAVSYLRSQTSGY